MKHAERAGDILDSYFRRNSISGAETYVAFHRSWEQIVGQDIASHTNLTEIRNHALCVEVDHPAWMQQVQLRQARILKAVQQRFPSLEIRTLHLRLVEKLGQLGSAPAPAAAPAAAPASAEPANADPAQAATEPSAAAPAPTDDAPAAAPASADSAQADSGHADPGNADPGNADPTERAIEQIDSPALRASLQRLRQAVNRKDRQDR